MTDDDTDDTADHIRTVTVKGGTLTIDGEEHDLEELSDEELRDLADRIDAADADEGMRIPDWGKTYTATASFTAEPQPVEFDQVTISTDDGEMTASDVTVETMDQHDERLEQMEADAPDPEYLTDGSTCAIDDVIDALEEAKARGVDTVYVNDDGQTQHVRPRLTNNMSSLSRMAPPPEELREWVEL